MWEMPTSSSEDGYQWRWGVETARSAEHADNPHIISSSIPKAEELLLNFKCILHKYRMKVALKNLLDAIRQRHRTKIIEDLWSQDKKGSPSIYFNQLQMRRVLFKSGLPKYLGKKETNDSSKTSFKEHLDSNHSQSKSNSAVPRISPESSGL